MSETPAFSRTITRDEAQTWYALKFERGAVVARVWERGGSVSFHDPVPLDQADRDDCRFLDGPCGLTGMLDDAATLKQIREGADPWPILAVLLVQHHADDEIRRI